MTFTLPLEPQKEAKLIALAKSKGTTADTLISEAVDKLMADIPDVSAEEPVRSLRGLLANYGSAPSAEAIDQNRAEMFANFARD